MRSFIASTDELDNSEVAVSEVLAQIDLRDLQTYSIGIINCHYEFAQTDIIKALCDALPFDVIGLTSSAQTVKGFELSLLVLTSDDAAFTTTLTDPLTGDVESAIGAAYTDAMIQAAGITGIDSKPKLILLHAPYIMMNNAENYTTLLSSLSGDVPVFGALSLDDTDDFHNCYAIYNGQVYQDRLVLALAFGNVNPHFYVANISPEKIVGDPALITSSNEQILFELNNRPFAEYMAELGLAESIEQQYAMSSLPFLLDYNDGTPPVSRIFIMLTPDGAAILNGSAPEGLELRVGAFDRDDVLQTADAVFSYALGEAAPSDDEVRGAYAAQANDDSGVPQALLIYSCFARNMALGVDNIAELQAAAKSIADKTLYMMTYVGGEYSPTKVAGGKASNRFHNNALIVCAL